MDLPKNLEKHWSEEFKSLMNYYPKTVWNKEEEEKKCNQPRALSQNSDLYCLDQPFGNWFEHAKVNTYDLCIGKHIKNGLNNKTAINSISPKGNIDSYSYGQIDNITSYISDYLTQNNPEKKPIILVGRHCIEVACLMLACAKNDIPFFVFFETITNSDYKKRINCIRPILCVSLTPLRQIEACEEKEIPSNKSFRIRKLIMSKLNEGSVRDSNLIHGDESYLFGLFTSGSTGIPKAVLHKTVQYLVYTSFTMQHFWKFNTNDVMLCASDAGWINGHTYALFGPLLKGGATCLVELPTCLLNEGILERIINHCECSHLYLPVTLIRMLRSRLEMNSKNSKIQTKRALKGIGSMGEPLAPVIKRWYANYFLKGENKPVVNTYFQTETGGILAAQRVGSNLGLSSGAISKLPEHVNMDINIMNDEIEITTPWPGCASYFIGNKEAIERYRTDEGNYRLHDCGYIENDQLFVTGRSDDILIQNGKNYSSTLIESLILEASENVIECASFSIPFDQESTILAAVLVLKNKLNATTYAKLKKQIREHVHSKLNQCLIRSFFVTKSLPKTKSGKIKRKMIRQSTEKLTKEQNGKYCHEQIDIIDDHDAVKYCFTKI